MSWRIEVRVSSSSTPPHFLRTFARCIGRGFMASRHSRRPLVLGLAALGIALVVLVALGAWVARPEHHDASKWVTVVPERRDIVRRIEATGTLRPTSMVHVGALVSGIIATTPVQAGDRVEAGQVIATVDDGAFRLQLTRAEASLAAMRLRQAEAHRQWERQRSLAAQGFVSDAAVEAARSQAEVANQDVTAARSDADAARLNLSHCVIRSPIDGQVLSKDIASGQSVASAFQVPDLFTIVSHLDPMEVVALFAESDLASVAPRARASLTVPAWPERHFEAKVERVLDTPENHQGVVMFPVILTSANPDGALRPGMTAYVEIHDVSRRSVLTLPNAAIAFARGHDRATGLAPSASRSGPSHVYALRGESLVPLPVTFGEADDVRTEITPGIPLSSQEHIVMKDIHESTP
jgi:HlyD family secretion protein